MFCHVPAYMGRLRIASYPEKIQFVIVARLQQPNCTVLILQL